MNYIKSLITLFVFVYFCSCHIKNNKLEYKWTTKIADSLFVETFRVDGFGVYSTDIVSDYLTDSLNFRIKVGTFSEGDEFLYYQIYDNNIKIKKIESKGNIDIIKDSIMISIPKLKELKNKDNELLE